jgi:hypothetical protein
MTDTNQPPDATPEWRTRGSFDSAPVTEGSRTGHDSGVHIDSVEPRIGGNLWNVDGTLGGTPFRAIVHVHCEDDDESDGELWRLKRAPRLIDLRADLYELVEVDRDGEDVGCLPASVSDRYAIEDASASACWEKVEHNLRLQWERACEGCDGESEAGQ